MNYIVGLDVGSHAVKAAVAERRRDGSLHIMKLIKMPCAGMRRGVVDDVAEVTRSLNAILAEVKKVAPRAVKNIYLSFGSKDVRMRPSRGMVIVSRADSEIHQDDVDRVNEAASAVSLKDNRTVLHALTQEYIVDGVDDIRNPIGMTGNKLEANGILIDAFEPSVKSVAKCVEIAGGTVSGVILSTLATSQAVLSKNQKELGVIMVEIGAGTTGVAVYEEGKLLQTAVMPVGSAHITNDLAIGMKSEVGVAETVKLTFGAALPKAIPARESIELQKISAEAEGAVARRFVAEIIEARLAELFEFIDGELKRINRSAKLPGGVVLTGGGAKLPSLVDLAKRELRLSAHVGIADGTRFALGGSDLAGQMEDPEFACALGLLLVASEKTEEPSQPARGGFFKRIVKYFLP